MSENQSEESTNNENNENKEKIKESNETQPQPQNNPKPIIENKYEILSEDHTDFDMSFKLIVIGDSGVGKSCLTNNAVKNIFNDSYNATVGFEFFTFNIKINDKVVKLQIWDTCGQELYRSLITNFYRNSSLAIIVYAINSKESFEDIEMWLRELRTHSSPDIKVFLIGNKVDLEDEREIKKEEGEAFCKENKINLFMESSAKTGFNAQNIFIKAAQLLYDNYLKYHDLEETKKNNEDDNSDSYQNSRLSSFQTNKNANKGGCC